MVKAYLRYDFAGAFGVITSAANPEFDADGKHIFTGALENVSVWNMKQGTQVRPECVPMLTNGVPVSHRPRLLIAGVLSATLLGEHLHRERGRGDGDGSGAPCTRPGRRLLGWHGKMVLHECMSVAGRVRAGRTLSAQVCLTDLWPVQWSQYPPGCESSSRAPHSHRVPLPRARDSNGPPHHLLSDNIKSLYLAEG